VKKDAAEREAGDGRCNGQQDHFRSSLREHVRACRPKRDSHGGIVPTFRVNPGRRTAVRAATPTW